mgnify:CR=1 FL=1
MKGVFVDSFVAANADSKGSVATVKGSNDADFVELENAPGTEEASAAEAAAK